MKETIKFKEKRGFTEGEVIKEYVGISMVIGYDVKVSTGEILTISYRDVE